MKMAENGILGRQRDLRNSGGGARGREEGEQTDRERERGRERGGGRERGRESLAYHTDWYIDR